MRSFGSSLIIGLATLIPGFVYDLNMLSNHDGGLKGDTILARQRLSQPADRQREILWFSRTEDLLQRTCNAWAEPIVGDAQPGPDL
jgi:hypothetical protein